MWRRVQVERPSWSTSGGQSGGGSSGAVGCAKVEVVMVECGAFCCLVIAAHEANDVQDRQLHLCKLLKVYEVVMEQNVRLPVGPKNNTLR